MVIAVISAVELYNLWGEFDERFWIFLAFMILSIFMFFFRRRQRKRYEEARKEEVEK